MATSTHEAVSQQLRANMPVSERWRYFDHAAVAPISGPARAAVEAWATEAAEMGERAWLGWQARIEEARVTAAAVLGASPAEIAWVANTTAGISIVAEGLPWQVGDNVVVASNEFPSNLYPWLNLATRGVEARRVPPSGMGLDLDRLDAAIDGQTRVVAVSWVGFATGWRADLDELADMAKRRGILLFVDAIQGLGVFPVDVSRNRIDFLAADGHKWLLGPEGAGMLYVRRENLDRIRLTQVGWNSCRPPHDFSRSDGELRDTAARFEAGTHNAVGVLGLGASLALLRRLGLGPDSSPIADRVLEYGELCCQRLEKIGGRILSDRRPRHRSGILACEFPGIACGTLRRRCGDRRVVVNCRQGWLRISPHAYNNDTDLDHLIDALLSAQDSVRELGGG